ncbi:PREDICTED: glutactin-like isoform X1 [Rhagoletis zephyria]|uniref:glutactin-like isoform X1 n=1 Tax=Rhagoletis zephyria TaxID=28612 RepID=UPI0008113CD7|nr:PREDICTED: glutactin-like isoform X1 [Rhagoletis zephyria]
MRVFLGILALALVITIITLTVSKAIPTDSPVVNIYGQGPVRGSYDETLWTKQQFLSFRGIPYAESPSGKLRFKPPTSRKPWQKTFDAQNFGKRCPVITSVSKLNASKLKDDLEDCLNLSVYTKSLNARQPVMFYIYGGGFSNGSASDHPPHHLLEKDIVLVVPQYRIGALGWLTTLTEEMPGNAPVMDLQLALSWVQKYIYTFGGDRDKVTIFGQSAGAAMSGALLLSPKTSESYFKRSIVQSGAITAFWAINREPLAQVKRICEALNCEQCDDSAEQYKCLRSVNVLQLLRVTTAESFSPVVADVFGVLPSEPRVLLENLKRTVPLMAGFTKHDGSFALATLYDSIVAMLGSISKLTVRQFANTLIDVGKDSTSLSNNLLLRMLFEQELLESNNHTAAWPAYFDAANIIAMKSPVIAYANGLQRRGAAPVYLYSFDYEGEHTRFGYEFGNSQYPFEGGVHHSNDNIYLFATHKLNANDTRIAMKMVDLWYSFAVHGEPKVGDQPELDIRAMKTEAGPYFHINKQITLGSDILSELTATVDDPDSHKLIRPSAFQVTHIRNNVIEK